MSFPKRLLLLLAWPVIAALVLVAVAGFLTCIWPLTLNNTFVSAFLAGSKQKSPPSD